MSNQLTSWNQGKMEAGKDVASAITCKRYTSSNRRLGDTEGKRVYRVDIDFKNAFKAMSQAALWRVMRMFQIPDVDLSE